MRWIVDVTLVPVVALALVVSGCASNDAREAPPGPTTLSGTAALAAFPVAPRSVTATDESGTVATSRLGTDGHFSIALPKGHTYKLALTGDHSSVPVAFPRASGKLDASFVLKSDGAAVRLGTVRYVPKMPDAGFRIVVTRTATPTAVDCVDCVNDDGTVTCARDGQNGEGEGEAASSHAARETAPGADTSEQLDPTREMAVGDQNAPEHVDGCGGEGDNVDQSGEH